LGGSASVVVFMVRTTPPKEDKAGTSSVVAPTAQALVARSGSKAPDDSLADDDPDLLNFAAAKPEIICRMSSRLQNCWPDVVKLDCLIWHFEWSDFHAPDAGSDFLVLGHEDVECGRWAAFQLAPLILLPLAIIRTFWFDHHRRPFFSYDNLFYLDRLSLRWPDQDLLPLELDHIHIHRERILVELYLGTFCKFQSSFIYGRLNLSMENIVTISSMRIRIVPFAIYMLFELFR
jgi:hypothetical protein